MRIVIILVLMFSITMSACSYSPPIASIETAFTPREAIMLAADAAPEGLEGLFEMKVEGTGRDGGYIYLNSEADYRDQRSLNIAVHPQAAKEFLEVHDGIPPDVFLAGKLIRVSGEAKRTRIAIICGGSKTEMYYYQTQVHVVDMSQIKVLGQ